MRKLQARVTCMRCQKTAAEAEAIRDMWNVDYKKGLFIGHICGACQTPEESMEAMVNEALYDYTDSCTGADGLAYTRMRPQPLSTSEFADLLFSRAESVVRDVVAKIVETGEARPLNSRDIAEAVLDSLPNELRFSAREKVEDVVAQMVTDILSGAAHLD